MHFFQGNLLSPTYNNMYTIVFNWNRVLFMRIALCFTILVLVPCNATTYAAVSETQCLPFAAKGMFSLEIHR